MDTSLYLKNKAGDNINFYFCNKNLPSIEVEIVKELRDEYFYLETQQIVELASFLNELIKTHNLDKQ